MSIPDPTRTYPVWSVGLDRSAHKFACASAFGSGPIPAAPDLSHTRLAQISAFSKRCNKPKANLSNDATAGRIIPAMTFEVTYVDEIPEGDGPYETGLWARARWWVFQCLNIFGEPGELAAVGLTRRVALRCKNWLWTIEGAVRRLIIAAALAIDPASLPLAPAKSGSSQRTATPAPDKPAKPTFRVFAIHRPSPSSGAPIVDREHAASDQPHREPRPRPLHRHVPFIADDLLTIGATAAHAGRTRRASVRRINPLDRRGRPSRWDPDYVYDEAEEQAKFDRSMFGPVRTEDSRTPPPPREPKQRDLYFRRRHSSSIFEWRRIDEEWKRVLPAPDLGKRIFALCRVMEKPERWITRLARLLARNKQLARQLTAVPPPVVRKPKRDRTPNPPNLELLNATHAAIPRLDTS
jgi:hypothetical protein